MEALLQIPAFFWSLSVFVVFVLILLKFAVKPVIQAMDARDAKIKQQVEEAEATPPKAKELQQQLDEQLAGAEAKIAELMQDARKSAEENKAKIVDDGRTEVDAMRTRALREIEAARHAAIVDLRNEVAEVATRVAGKILDEQLDSSRHQQLVADAIDEYEAAHGGANS